MSPKRAKPEDGREFRRRMSEPLEPVKPATRAKENESSTSGDQRVAVPVITRLAAKRDTPKVINVYVGRARAASVPIAAIADLGLRVGLEWTRERSKQVLEAEAVARVRRFAEASLVRSPESESNLRVRLLAKGHAAETVDRALAGLRSAGLLDERRLAASIARTQGRGRGALAIRDELESRGFDAGEVRRATGETILERGSDEAEAAKFVTTALRSMGARTPDTIARRLLAALARRGFDEDVARRVVERATGRRLDEEF